MDRFFRGVVDWIRGSPTPEEFEANVKEAIAKQRELERQQMAQMDKQGRLVRGIPRTAANAERLKREFGKFRSMQNGLEQRSKAIMNLENILHQVAQYRETAQEAQLASAMPQMMERFNMPDIRTIERDMSTMQRLVADSQEVSSVVSDGLTMGAMTLDGPDALQLNDPMALESELSQFLAEGDAECQQQHASPTPYTGVDSTTSLSALPHVPKHSNPTTASGSTMMVTKLKDMGW